MRFSAPDLLPEFEYKSRRSGGAGGQQVKQVATKVQLQFNVLQSPILTEEEKAIITTKLENQLSEEGLLQVTSQEGRSQHANKLDAIKKMYRLLNKCFEVPKPRKPSKPTKSSIIKKKVLKKRNSVVKQMRNKRNISDND
jgi:ribosome-associated protein